MTTNATANATANTAAPRAGSAPDAALAEQTVYRKLLWRLMPMLMLLYIVAFIDRSNVGFAKLSFLHDQGLSESVFGIGAGIFYAGYMLFEVPSNLLLA
ncbi:MAG: MFS transporter, partial [Paraburkholderia graminis]